MLTPKDKYRNFSETETSLPLFSRAWWLDAVTGHEGWDVVLVEKDNKIVASMPFAIRKKWGITIIGQPPLTPTLGPWIKRPTNQSHTKGLASSKELYNELINQLPSFGQFTQNWHYKQSNWLPFYWEGFSQTTRYTYLIKDLSCIEKTQKTFQGKIRTDIKKAVNRYELITTNDINIDDFYILFTKVFQRQNKPPPYTIDFLRKVDNACRIKKSRHIIAAKDKSGNIHAAVYLVWDDNCTYYLMSGSDPGLRNSGAVSLCLFEAIQFATTVTEEFDFEGSMIEPIERFFRAFGALQTPYHSVNKTTSKRIKLFQLYKELFLNKLKA